MDWEQKFAAINALNEDDTYIVMRKPGDWYVHCGAREVKRGSILDSRFGNGRNPWEAIEDDWHKITNLASDEYIVLNSGSDNRIAVKWNGYMWVNVKEKQNVTNYIS